MKRLLPVLLVIVVLAGILAVPASAAGSAPTVTYTVQPGDTLAKIGRQFCTPWQEIYHLNRAVIGPNPNVLVPGTVLQVPNHCGGPHPPPPPPPPCPVYDHGPTLHASGTVHGNIYTVAWGDTSFSVSRRFGLTVDQLAAANNLANPNYIYGGQKLVIPGLGSCPPHPGNAYITITSPAPGAVLPPTFTVSGTGGGLFEGALVVQAKNSAGQVLAQQSTTLQGANVGAGGQGTYSVQLTVNVGQNTAGTILTYSTSPKDGSVVASASVPVTFQPGGGTQPFITISTPATGAFLPPTFTVSGTGGGLFEGSLVVRAQSNSGQVLAEQPVTLQGANVGAGGTGSYSVQLTVHVSQNTAGKIVAFATSPKDGSVVASASVPVTFTPGGSPPFITINNPPPGAALPTTFTVSGTGGGLFEGSLIVRAQDNAGHILAQQPTTLQGTNVGAGGQGTYSVQLTVNVTASTPGMIMAYAPSPAGSGMLAQASVSVTFTPGSATYKVYAPGQCVIQGKPGAPFYAYPGGPQTGYFGSGGSFGAIRGAKVASAYWYEIYTDPGAGNPPAWVPHASTNSVSSGCAF
jgi:LysM repeat protein